MKKQLSIAVLLFAAACASMPAGQDAMPAPVTPAPDPRVADLQTQLTELLERIDVLNERIARMEEGAANSQELARVAAPPAPVAATSTPRPLPVADSSERLGGGPMVPAASIPQRETPAVPQQRAIVGANIAEDYRQAIMLVGRNRQADARRAFEGVYEADPNGDLADNALFWIGETYFSAKDYTNAVRYYMRVVNDYASQNKAPDALFKTAMAQERTGDLALARRTLQQVIERYPYSTPASSAKAELERTKF